MRLINIFRYNESVFDTEDKEHALDSLEGACEETRDALAFAIEHNDGFPGYQWRDAETGKWYETIVSVTIEEITSPREIADYEAEYKDTYLDDNDN